MTKKDREREQARRERSRNRLQGVQEESCTPPLLPLEEINPSGAVIVVRTSRPQDKEAKLFSQEQGIRKVLEKHEVAVVAAYTENETGKSLRKQDRPSLHAALRHARTLKVPVVAACPSRFLRHPEFSVSNPDVLPTRQQWKELEKLAAGVPLAVCYMTRSNDEDEQILAAMTRNHPYPRIDPAWVVKKVKKMRSCGYSYRKIAERMTTGFGVPMSYGTVRRLLQ